ncbi:hypothetical protein H8958_009171 [Nasalis larvatus]
MPYNLPCSCFCLLTTLVFPMLPCMACLLSLGPMQQKRKTMKVCISHQKKGQKSEVPKRRQKNEIWNLRSAC